MKQYTKPKKSWTLFGLGFVETIASPWLGFLWGVFLANHLASTDKQNNQKTEHIETQTNDTLKVAVINSTKEHTQTTNANTVD